MIHSAPTPESGQEADKTVIPDIDFNHIDLDSGLRGDQLSDDERMEAVHQVILKTVEQAGLTLVLIDGDAETNTRQISDFGSSNQYRNN